MRYIFKIMLLACIMLTGCVYDYEMEEEVKEDIQPSNIRLLFGRHGRPWLTLIEFVEPDDFRVVSISLLSHRWPQDTEEYNNYHEQNIYGMSLLEDFFSDVPYIEYIIQGIHRRYVVQETAMQLSSEQLQEILILVDNVASNNGDREFHLGRPSLGYNPYVWAIINGNVYWTFYDRVEHFYHNGQPREHLIEYANFDLLELAYKLVDLSPLPVGGECRSDFKLINLPREVE